MARNGTQIMRESFCECFVPVDDFRYGDGGFPISCCDGVGECESRGAGEFRDVGDHNENVSSLVSRVADDFEVR
jgi:hypothetical protein